jgi:hypothetical protein
MSILKRPATLALVVASILTICLVARAQWRPPQFVISGETVQLNGPRSSVSPNTQQGLDVVDLGYLSPSTNNVQLQSIYNRQTLPLTSETFSVWVICRATASVGPATVGNTIAKRLDGWMKNTCAAVDAGAGYIGPGQSTGASPACLTISTDAPVTIGTPDSALANEINSFQVVPSASGVALVEFSGGNPSFAIPLDCLARWESIVD